MPEQADEEAHAGPLPGGGGGRHPEEDAVRDRAQSGVAGAGGGNEQEGQDAGQGLVAGVVGQGPWQELPSVLQGL